MTQPDPATDEQIERFAAKLKKGSPFTWQTMVLPIIARVRAGETELAALRQRVGELETVETWANSIIERLRLETDKRPRVLPGSPNLIDELMAQFKASEARAARLAIALRYWVDDTPCRYDHDDFCQAHYDSRPCKNEFGRAALTPPAQAAGEYVQALEREHEAVTAWAKTPKKYYLGTDMPSDEQGLVDAFRAVEAAREAMGR